MRLRRCILWSVSFLVACGGDPSFEALSPGASLGTQEAAVTIPSQGSATTVDIGCWNVEWFGSSSNGPTNDTLQQQNVRDVLLGSNLDIWGLEEVVSTTAFSNLKAQLSGYAGLLASDASVTSGSSFYSSSEQKVGILYKTSVASVQSARIILTANDSDFAGRPPLEVKMRVTLNGTARDIVVIVFHAKAFDDATSWQRRLNASNALKAYLDSTYPSTPVVVLGDWNDDVDTSITSGKASPYQNFVSDAQDYFFPTKALSDAKVASTASYPDMIDHQLVTNELKSLYVAGSAKVYRVDTYISSYATTTTDHFPVLTRYAW
ncbi:endonuclease/exonuclease/phosphatase family protein [Stigmatella aurantiaca]|uniref:Endonuclease/exonuclease/phosphatase domain protein n=1 Tax=Stigmatella aurantiaca (strain DW4/3-1) TaxID=378806 RepID=Q08RQ3_STIAD|nr:endonuclease/exonuclease/phosphatase family protein [Stigmatella aurantiaca]ADO72044.1 Endonuclease/exonuclease/phosphatase domain protein [Stigmatella aurantiaca DW4/3-1]EAU63158.1 endonuclease/exonuclease/phosphatase family [Stigmatella aurantiaca DW4/3-1]